MPIANSNITITLLPASPRIFGAILLLIITCASVSLLTPAFAEGSKAGDQISSIDTLLTEIQRETKSVSDLEKRLTGAEGIVKIALDSRMIRSRMNLLEQNLELIKKVAEAEKSGEKNDDYHQKALATLEAQLQAIDTAIGLLRARIVPPEASASASEQAAVFSRIFEEIDLLNHVYEIYIASIELAPHFGRDITAEKAALKVNLLDRAENGSILLELATSDIKALRASVAAVPDDAESKARLNVITTHVANLASGVASVLAMMESLEMDTTEYQNQLLLATGQITSDIFQVGVFTNLLIGWSETLWAGVIESGPSLIFNLILLVIIIYIFYKLAGLAQKLTETGLEDSRIELSLLLKRMVVSIVRNTVLIVGVLIALAQVGFSLGPLLAGMGLVGFVVGFALQDTLSNFAAGMLILIYRPFDVDDVIEAGGVSGLVSEMSLVNTTFLTFDNQTIIVPNSKIWGDVIKNVTAQTIRRIDLTFGIAYSDDIEEAEKIMAEVVAAHPAVLEEPETMIRLHELGDSSVNFIVRPWVNKDDYWETFWDLNRAMKLRFDQEGISIPFPQRDVHLHQQ
ncbi:mechanosensitive ion channel family protein [Gammaproteobacteria bacterium]|nr:mechanosensitive ion channel family protein [Gammaproteobacteria bacterium]